MSFLSVLTRAGRFGRRGVAGVRTRIPALALLLAVGVLSSCNSQSTHLAYVTAGSNGIFAYRIKNSNGVVTNIFTSPFLFGDSTFGLVVHPSNQFALVANQQDGTISRLKIDLTSGALTETLPRTPAGLSPGPMILDSGSSFLFVADQGLNQILVFSVAANGSLSQVSSAPVGSTPTGLVLASTGFLFVPVPNFSAIYVFSVSSGALTQVCSSSGPVCSPFKVTDGVASIAVDPAGKFLYATNPATNTVSGFVIQSGGSLTPVPGVVFATGISPDAAAVDPSGKSLYVTNSGATTLSQYTIDSTTGDLTALTTTSPNVGSNPGFIAFDPDGTFVYVANLGSHSITQLTINSDGSLGATSNTILVNAVPRALAFTK
jgi:6-phosphogluconolactonase (cycloisomerase 2 family)